MLAAYSPVVKYGSIILISQSLSKQKRLIQKHNEYSIKHFKRTYFRKKGSLSTCYIDNLKGSNTLAWMLPASKKYSIRRVCKKSIECSSLYLRMFFVGDSIFDNDFNSFSSFGSLAISAFLGVFSFVSFLAFLSFLAFFGSCIYSIDLRLFDMRINLTTSSLYLGAEYNFHGD